MRGQTPRSEVGKFHDWGLTPSGLRLAVLFEMPFERVDLVLERFEALGQRVWQVRMGRVEAEESAVLRPRDAAGPADDSGVLGHVSDDDGVGPDHRVAADGDVPQHFGAGADDDVVADRRVALAALLAGAAQRHPLEEGDVVADDGGLADHDPHPVVDEEAPADHRRGVDLYTGEPPRRRHEEPRQDGYAQPVEPMREAVDDERVEPGIGQQDFDQIAGCGVPLKAGADFRREEHSHDDQDRDEEDEGADNVPQRHGRYSTRTTACAAIASPRPTAPNPSFVCALMFTAFSGSSSVRAIVCAIAVLKRFRFGCSAMTVVSMLAMAKPSSSTRSPTRFNNAKLEMPR